MSETEPEKKKPWYRAYIDAPDYRDEATGRRIPKQLGGGSREHCEKVIAAYRKKRYEATQWPSKIVEVETPGRDPQVKFD